MGMAYLFLPLWDRQKDTNQYRSKQHGLVGSWYHASYIHKSMSIRLGIIGPAMRWKQTHVPSQTLGDLATISPWWGGTGNHPKHGLRSTVRMSNFMRFVQSVWWRTWRQSSACTCGWEGRGNSWWFKYVWFGSSCSFHNRYLESLSLNDYSHP